MTGIEPVTMEQPITYDLVIGTSAAALLLTIPLLPTRPAKLVEE